MRLSDIEILKCPNCRYSKFYPKVFRQKSEQIVDGTIECQKCGVWYRVQSGVVDLLPLALRREDLYLNFGKRFHLSYQPFGKLNKKNSQIDFFKKGFWEYERRVVGAKYYKALDKMMFLDWARKNLKSGSLVLDIGAGTGRQAIPAARLGASVIAVDISEEMLGLAYRKSLAAGVSDKITYVCADGENPPVVDNYFDACILYGTLHHLKNPSSCLKNVANRLKAGGFVYTLDPNKSPLRGIYELLAKIWKLYEEETGEGKLLESRKLDKWLKNADIDGKIYFSTYLPPHLFHLLSKKLAFALLKSTDFFNQVPIIKKWGGVVVAEGAKRANER